MSANPLPADQQFFADLLSGLVLNPQRLGRVWFADAAPGGSVPEWPQLEIVLRGEYGALSEGEMRFIPARTAVSPPGDKPAMVLSLVFAPAWLGLTFHDSRGRQPLRHITLPHPQRGEGEAMLIALTHLSRTPQDQAIIQPLVLSLLHLCRKVVNSLPGHTLPRAAFLYQSLCNWIEDNYASPLTRDSVAALFNITPNHLSRLFSQQGTMSFVDYVRRVRMAKARMILQKYHLQISEVALRCGFRDSDYFCRVFRRQFGLTPGEYRTRFQ